jgi:hypothetical protein
MTILDALFEAAVPELAPLDPIRAATVRQDCAESARRQLRASPLHIREAMRVLSWLFAAYVLLAARKTPSGMTRREIGRALSGFSRLPLGSLAALERLSRSLTLLAYFEHPTVLKALGEMPLGERQTVYRARRAASLATSP